MDFSKAITESYAWNSVLETARASLAVWLAAALGKLINSLGYREGQAHNGNVCSLVFTPAILFNDGKIWAAGGWGFAAHGYYVYVCDCSMSPSKFLDRKSSHRSLARVVRPSLQHTWPKNFSTTLSWVCSSLLANWFWIRCSSSSLKKSMARWLSLSAM